MKYVRTCKGQQRQKKTEAEVNVKKVNKVGRARILKNCAFTRSARLLNASEPADNYSCAEE